MFVPRPQSLVFNTMILCGGILFAWLEGYEGQGVSHQIDMPFLVYVLIWWLVQELLVQQAKYAWNDIRDHERDQLIPGNRSRPIARKPLSAWDPYLMAGRWLLGIFLAWLLSSELLAVIINISALQIAYELWAKPKAAMKPSMPMYVVGAGIMLKFSSGAILMGFPVGNLRLWLYGLALFATGVVFISSYWRVEAAHFTINRLVLPRDQSAYFAQRGMAWLRAGTLLTITVCAVLMIDGCFRFLGHVEVPIGLVLGLIMVGGVLGCRFFLSVVQQRLENLFLTVLLFLLAIVSSFIPWSQSLNVVSNETLAAGLLLIILMIDHRLNLIMDYRKQYRVLNIFKGN